MISTTLVLTIMISVGGPDAEEDKKLTEKPKNSLKFQKASEF